jgi:hypothetical protein
MLTFSKAVHVALKDWIQGQVWNVNEFVAPALTDYVKHIAP